MQMVTVWLFVTLALGIAFIFSQLEGFRQIIEAGYNFTGNPTSNITMSYIYIIAVHTYRTRHCWIDMYNCCNL